MGSSLHIEYWIPANRPPDFNTALQGTIKVHSAYFGPRFQGFVPDKGVLKDKAVLARFTTMTELLRLNGKAFAAEVILNQKAIYLNFMFWAQFDCAALDVDQKQRLELLDGIREAWESNHSAIVLSE